MICCRYVQLSFHFLFKYNLIDSGIDVCSLIIYFWSIFAGIIIDLHVYKYMRNVLVLNRKENILSVFSDGVFAIVATLIILDIW